MIDIYHQIANSLNVFGSLEERERKVEQFLDHKAILRDQPAFIEVDAVVGDVEDEVIPAIQHLGAFVVDLSGGSKNGGTSRDPNERLLVFIRNFNGEWEDMGVDLKAKFYIEEQVSYIGIQKTRRMSLPFGNSRNLGKDEDSWCFESSDGMSK